MNIYEAVKQSVTTRQAAELYGFRVERSGMIKCPFHNDKNPSMKVDQRFHCFGCGEDGDVIDFVSKLYGLGSKEAAEKLAEDFSISYDKTSWNKRDGEKKYEKVVRKKSHAELQKEAEQYCFLVLSDYFHQLKKWETEYAPQAKDEGWNPLFVEALLKKTYVESLLNILLEGTDEEKALLLARHGREVVKIEQRLSKLNTRDRGIDYADSGFYAAMQQSGRGQRVSGIDR